MNFEYRVAGVAWDGERVLLGRAYRDKFWSLPGGPVEAGESALDALRRRMLQELDAEVRVERLLWVVDHFFAVANEPRHGLEMFFEIEVPELVRSTPHWDIRRDGKKYLFQWFPLEELEQLPRGRPLRPTFLPEALRRPPTAPEYRVHHGDAR